MSFLSFTLEELRNLNLKDFFKRLYTKAFDEEDLMSAAAQVAFYFAFALFPLLLFLISLFGIVLETADDLRAEMFFYLRQVMPASAYDLVKDTVDEVTENSSGGKLTFGILVALWSASAGIDSIRIALNGVFNLTETRAWWKTKLISLSMTFGLGILVTIALGVVFYGGKFISFILESIKLPIQSPIFLGILQWVTVLVVLISIFALLYNFLPKYKKSSWVWITPGAIIGIVLWLLLSYGFKLYLGYFNTYDKTYGSLGAVIILMLWLYLTALVILIGGSINAVLQEFSDPETAKAGEIKAAAKEILQHPDADHTAIAKTIADKTDTAAENKSGISNDKDIEIKEEKSGTVLERLEADDKPVNKTSALKLITGIVIGFFSRNKKN
jgi:membrane protein